MNIRFFTALFIGLICLSSPVSAKMVEYDINIDFKMVNFTGTPVHAMTVGGTIPGPTISATLGDTLRVTFHNRMDVETSIHWHGVLLPNDQDGVPHLTTTPIAPHSSHTFEYPVIHTGTYWYHSHTGLQEQRGVYGSIVFHEKTADKSYDHDKVIVLSDWNDENPEVILRHLKRDGDYYALKKNSVQSWLGVIRNKAVKERMGGSLSRMGPMDLSDVGYDAFLVNGQKSSRLVKAVAGEKLRLRLINAAASSYFNVEFSGGPMTVIAADGMKVKSFKVKRLRTAIAETWDVIVEIPDSKTYELRATSEDGTGYAVTLIGEGEIVHAPDIPRPNLYKTDHSMHGQMDHAAMGHTMEGQVIEHLTDYKPLISPQNTELKNPGPAREVLLALTGNMEDYVWSFNNKTLSEADSILIRKGEKVRFILDNKTMMHHPVHLHGHFFRVLNGQGKFSPLKHTVNVPPMEKVIIEFDANEDRDWFFHCHNLYHMKSGMARVVSYEGTSQMTNATRARISGDRQWYSFADISAQSHMAQARLWTRNSTNNFAVEAELDYEGQHEIEATYSRTLNRYLKLYAGGWFEREMEDGFFEKRTVGMAGVTYILPLLIEATARIDTKGHFRFGLESSLQLTNRVKFMWEWNTDDEVELQLEYEATKHLSLIGGYNSDYGGGGGILIKF